MVRRGEEMTEREWAIPSRPLRQLWRWSILALIRSQFCRRCGLAVVGPSPQTSRESPLGSPSSR